MQQLRDDLRQRIGVGANRSSAWTASQRTQPRLDHLRLLADARHEGLFDGQQRVAAHIHRPLLGEVKIDDGNLFLVDVLPYVHLRPVGERKNANAFAGMNAGVVEIPQLGALVLRIPLAGRIAERVDALLGADFSSSRRAPPKAASKL